MASVLTPAQQSDLAQQLRAIVGHDAVVDKPDELLVYECDAYTLEKNPPNAVVLPRTTEQVSQIVKTCASLNVPIIPRGAGTSLSGSLLAVSGGVVISLARMNRVLSVDIRNRRALG